MARLQLAASTPRARTPLNGGLQLGCGEPATGDGMRSIFIRADFSNNSKYELWQLLLLIWCCEKGRGDSLGAQVAGLPARRTMGRPVSTPAHSNSLPVLGVRTPAGAGFYYAWDIRSQTDPVLLSECITRQFLYFIIHRLTGEFK